MYFLENITPVLTQVFSCKIKKSLLKYFSVFICRRRRFPVILREPSETVLLHAAATGSPSTNSGTKAWIILYARRNFLRSNA